MIHKSKVSALFDRGSSHSNDIISESINSKFKGDSVILVKRKLEQQAVAVASQVMLGEIRV